MFQLGIYVVSFLFSFWNRWPMLVAKYARREESWSKQHDPIWNWSSLSGFLYSFVFALQLVNWVFMSSVVTSLSISSDVNGFGDSFSYPYSKPNFIFILIPNTWRILNISNKPDQWYLGIPNTWIFKKKMLTTRRYALSTPFTPLKLMGYGAGWDELTFLVIFFIPNL